MTDSRGDNLEGCVRGSLADWPLQDLLLFLHHSGRTAMLRVGAGLDAAVMFLENGQLYRCEWGGLQGEAALRSVLQLRSGDFVLMQRECPQPRPNIGAPTQELLLKLAAHEDEARHQAAATAL